MNTTFQPKYVVKTAKRNTIMNTKEIAKVLSRAPRTVRRYAQFGQVRAAYKSAKKGWQFVTTVEFMVG